jgi:hypothetical protein
MLPWNWLEASHFLIGLQKAEFEAWMMMIDRDDGYDEALKWK